MVVAYEKAKKSYEHTHKIAIAVSDKGLAADSLVGLGLTLRGIGRHKQVLSIFAKSQRIYEIAKDKAGLAFLLWAKAGLTG
ncbi:MAG: tetratricopeptide repeat protein [Deltaproteobacteria bacterium]|nr:tetratricopeptide repeat protein [Deltaproteobacteria bacterium]